MIFTPLPSDLSSSYLITMMLVLLFVVFLGLIWIIADTRIQLDKMQRTGIPVMQHPPQGCAYPLIGHALTFLQYKPWDLMMYWHQQYGPAVCFSLMFTTMISFASPSLLKAVLQSQIASVKKDVATIMKPFMVILGNGIVSAEGSSWMKQRVKMSHPLRHDILQIIPQQTLVAMQRWMDQLDQADHTGRPIPVGQSLRHLTLQVISGSFLSLSAKESDETFAAFYLPIVEESNRRLWHPYRTYCFFLPSFWHFFYCVYQLNRYVSGLIRQRWQLRRQEAAIAADHAINYAKGKRRSYDMLDRVLQYYEQKDWNGTDQTLPQSVVCQFRDEMKTFMLAGHETSASMMTWTLYELLGQPSLIQRLEIEAATVFDETRDWKAVDAVDHLPAPERLALLQLSEACLKESLRKYSVVPVVARRAAHDMYVEVDNDDKLNCATSSDYTNNKKPIAKKAYWIPRGSSVVINIQAVHWNPVYWPEPSRYRPDRFLGDAAEKIQPFTFLPFIAGPRNCLGQHLALLESKMVISLLLQRYDISLAHPCYGGISTIVDSNKDWTIENDPRHRYMIPIIPKQELMVMVRRKKQPNRFLVANTK